jgi:hypothetical protein
MTEQRDASQRPQDEPHPAEPRTNDSSSTEDVLADASPFEVPLGRRIRESGEDARVDPDDSPFRVPTGGPAQDG